MKLYIREKSSEEMKYFKLWAEKDMELSCLRLILHTEKWNSIEHVYMLSNVINFKKSEYISAEHTEMPLLNVVHAFNF